MSAEIQQTLIQSVTEGRLVLNARAAARTMSIGSNWTRLRIGARVAVADSGQVLHGHPRLYLGIMANPDADLTNGPLGITSHFLGVTTNSQDWVYGASTYLTGISAAVKVGAGAPNLSDPITPMRVSLLTGSVRTALIVLLDRGPGHNPIDAAVGAVFNHSATPVDIEYSDLIAAMEADPEEDDLLTRLQSIRDVLDIAAGDTQHTAAVLTPSIATNDVVDGPLGSLCVAWSKTDAQAFISEIVFAKAA